MTKVFALCNQKGGVGKTTTGINLAASLALAGVRTLLIDLDPQGNSTSGLGVSKTDLSKTVYDILIGRAQLSETLTSTGIDLLTLIPANSQLAGAQIELVDALGREFILRQAIKELIGSSEGENAALRFEFIFIDCPPSLGILTLNALAAADKILIPMQCEYYALEGLGQLLETYKLVKERLNPALDIGGVVLTMADFRTNLTAEVIREVKNYFGEKVFSAIIPRSVKLSEAPSFGKPAVLYDPAGRGSQLYQELAQEFLKRERDGVEKESVPSETLEETR